MDEPLPIVAVRTLVLFPGVVAPVTVTRALSVAAAQAAMRAGRPLGIVLQRNSAAEEPGAADMHGMGTAATVLRYVTTEDGQHHIVCQGLHRFRVAGWVEGGPFLAARVAPLADADADTPELRLLTAHLRERALEALHLLPQAPQELLAVVRTLGSPGELADFTAGFMDLRPAEKQAILETEGLAARLQRVAEGLADRVAVLRLSRGLRMLEEQDDEDESPPAETVELAAAIEAAGMPPEVHAQARRELKRLERMPELAAEHSMVRGYLDWLVELPWGGGAEPAIDLAAARRVLDAEHFGVEAVKRRILEFLAVCALNPCGRRPILCLAGPPGVGKTSLGQSIARATGRAFARVALGGVHDEAEVRGHRRTYIGALPGSVVQGLRRAGTRDCVMMLDEVDKLGRGGRGDPAAALLEVLDPEQNAAFRDAYLDVPVDLSRVLFIATANVVDAIPAALRDRLEVIELSGYTGDEKLEIARGHLLPRQLAAHGLTAERLEIGDDALRVLIRDHTREAGNRELERRIAAICRHAAVRIAEGEAGPLRIGAAEVPGILGPPTVENEVALRAGVPGVVTALAWTPAGGDILFIEAARFPGSGRLILTGQLGEVMKESAQAALSLVKTRWRELGLDADTFAATDLHLHVPAGAIPKDGPSAGLAMAAALVSLLTGRAVAPDTAMTGEISLRGLVLPVGGVKDKVVAAHRAGIRTVVLPGRNRKDLEAIPAGVRDSLRFVWVEGVDEALAALFGGGVDPS
ncbi:endopeptidase La [Azospirillum sp. TSO22-1]|uniref:endopeptidase La n=1 Tax=Azospirillum sp. TSO22-1 TaxID=716789 RepID=UPI000D61BEB7|nr:endopeptidase La [Azospirillum sp. TSO22-1]PWC43061.1 DNA-binding protein [Azospirillum sp. TSO22-1]